MEYNMEIPVWMYVVSMTGYIVFLVLIVAFMRKYLKITTVWWFLVLLTIPFGQSIYMAGSGGRKH
jgi:hypothetical protein